MAISENTRRPVLAGEQNEMFGETKKLVLEIYAHIKESQPKYSDAALKPAITIKFGSFNTKSDGLNVTYEYKEIRNTEAGAMLPDIELTIALPHAGSQKDRPFDYLAIVEYKPEQPDLPPPIEIFLRTERLVQAKLNEIIVITGYQLESRRDDIGQIFPIISSLHTLITQ